MKSERRSKTKKRRKGHSVSGRRLFKLLAFLHERDAKKARLSSPASYHDIVSIAGGVRQPRTPKFLIKIENALSCLSNYE